MGSMDQTLIEPFSWWLVAGYAYSLVLGHLCVSRFVRASHGFSGTNLEPGQPELAATVGFLERALYTSLWLMGSSGADPGMARTEGCGRTQADDEGSGRSTTRSSSVPGQHGVLISGVSGKPDPVLSRNLAEPDNAPTR